MRELYLSFPLEVVRQTSLQFPNWFVLLWQWLHNQLNKDILYHVAVHVGEAEVAALVAVGEFAVIDPELVQDGGVEVMDVHCAWGPLVPGGLGLEHVAVGIGNVVAVVVGATISNARLDAATGHPD